jgi:hypothetical protein
MKLYSQQQFINIFVGTNSPTFAKFMQNARVTTSSGKIVALKQYAKEREIPTEDLKTLYQHILNRAEYLARFWVKSLRPIEPITINQKPMPKSALNNDSMPNYKNLIRNMHLLDILQNTKSGLENLPTFMHVLKRLYLEEIIDYKILTPSARHYMNEGRIGSVFSSFYFRASIMNPYLVYSICQKMLCETNQSPGTLRVFSPTLGWTSYAYGFMECPMVQEYVATDVIKSVCNKTREFCQQNYPQKKYKIFSEPSENLFKNRDFMKNYGCGSYFDAVFFSPPYYELELYPGQNQSTSAYTNYEDWLANYWTKTVELCYHVLKKGGRMCYILSSYGCSGSARCADNEFDILKDMNTICGQYFKKVGAFTMKNKNVHVTAGSHRETGERIMLFVKA